MKISAKLASLTLKAFSLPIEYNNGMKQSSSRRNRTKGAIAHNLYHLLLATLAAMIFGTIVLGEVFDAYGAFWWWDDMWHGVSGLIAGLVGMLTIYLFNAQRTAPFRPLFVAVFVFCFGLTVSVLWEFYEFAMDYFFKFTMQQWDMHAGAIVMGQDYQGMGLRDTMSDLIMALLGTIAAAVFAFFAYSRERPIVLGVMRRAFPWAKRLK